MDLDWEHANDFLQEMRRIAPGDGDAGVTFPSDMSLEEAVRRLAAVPDGAGWEAISQALNSSPPA